MIKSRASATAGGTWSFMRRNVSRIGGRVTVSSCPASSSSGSTHVGLSQFFRNSTTRVIGIASDPEPEIAEDFAELSGGLGALLGESGLSPSEFNLKFDFVGPGYGIPSEAGNAAIRDLAQTEGIFLDPIYSGKAFAAVLELAKKGELSGRTCFWHTGGLPSLFSMQSNL